MRKYNLVVILVLSTIFFSKAQNIPICAVKYKEYKTNMGTHNVWFLHNKLISIQEPSYRAQFMNGFPVIINGHLQTVTDTVKYNKEFNEIIREITEQRKNAWINVRLKYYKSDIVETALFIENISKKFILSDTLASMNSWQILSDTSTIMGYKCQQASINYKQDKYFAWFTTQLPYNAGPYEFRGLPGLILKVSNVSASIGYEAVEILTPFKGIVPKFDQTGEIISRKQWITIANESNRKEREAYDNRRKQINKENEIKNQ